MSVQHRLAEGRFGCILPVRRELLRKSHSTVLWQAASRVRGGGPAVPVTSFRPALHCVAVLDRPSRLFLECMLGL